MYVLSTCLLVSGGVPTLCEVEKYTFCVDCGVRTGKCFVFFSRYKVPIVLPHWAKGLDISVPCLDGTDTK